jgi:hypothetical protein
MSKIFSSAEIYDFNEAPLGTALLPLPATDGLSSALGDLERFLKLNISSQEFEIQGLKKRNEELSERNQELRQSEALGWQKYRELEERSLAKINAGNKILDGESTVENLQRKLDSQNRLTFALTRSLEEKEKEAESLKRYLTEITNELTLTGAQSKERDERTELKLRLDFQRQLAEFTSVIMQKDLEINEARTATVLLQSTLEKTKSQVLELEGRLHLVNTREKADVDAYAALERQVTELNGSLNEQNLEVKRLRISEQSLRAKLETSDSKAFFLKERLAVAIARASNFRQSLKSAASDKTKFEEAFVAQRQACEALQINCNELTANNNTLLKRVTEQSAEIDLLKTHLMTARQDFEGSPERTKMQARLDALELELAGHKKSSAEEIMKLKEESSRLIFQLEESARAQEVRAGLEAPKIKGLYDQLNIRDQQLRYYAEALTREKAALLKAAQQLAHEIRTAGLIHPLKDYLTLTEVEISKLELQLRKTPTLSSERIPLETCFTQMIQQREFLRNLMNETQMALEAKAKKVIQIAGNGKLAPVPPPPPKHGLAEKNGEAVF